MAGAFILTKQQLAQLLPGNPYIDNWYHALEQCLPEYDINTPRRVAAFIAQCAHETGNFKFLKENLKISCGQLGQGVAQVFP